MVFQLEFRFFTFLTYVLLEFKVTNRLRWFLR